MDALSTVREKHIKLMERTAATLGNILRNTTQEQAESLRDGPEGWTILEVVCHLRDFDNIFRNRAQMMLDEETPHLPAYDHEKMAIDKNYAEEDLAYVYDEFLFSRKQTIAFFEALTDEQWERTGIHPEQGYFPMTAAVMQVGHHDVNHLEQITRLLEQEVPGSGALPSEDLDGDDDPFDLDDE